MKFYTNQRNSEKEFFCDLMTEEFELEDHQEENILLESDKLENIAQSLPSNGQNNNPDGFETGGRPPAKHKAELKV